MRKLRSIAIALLPAVLLLVDVLVRRWVAAAPAAEGAQVLLAGLLSSQLGLLCVFGVLGRQRWFVRVPIAVAGAAMLGAVWLLPDPPSGVAPHAIAQTLASMACVVAVLSVARLRGQSLSVVSTGDLEADLRGGQLQFRTMHLFLAVTYVAIMIVLANVLRNQLQRVGQSSAEYIVATSGVAAAVGAAITLGAVWVALGRRQMVARLVVLVFVALAAGWWRQMLHVSVPWWHSLADGLHALLSAGVLSLYRGVSYRVTHSTRAPVATAPGKTARLRWTFAALSLVVLAALPGAYRSWQQAKAVEIVLEAGGQILERAANGDVRGLSFSSEAVAAARVANQFDRVAGAPIADVANGTAAGAQATDATLEHVGMLIGLEDLDLSGTKITDHGVARLKDLANLRWLNLGFTAITDAAVPDLLRLKQLNHLDVTGTAVSTAAADRLQKALPDLTVTRSDAVADADRPMVIALREMGAEVQSDNRAIAVSYSRRGAGGVLEQVVKLSGLTELSLAGSDVSDDDLASLDVQLGQRIGTLGLDLKDTEVSDAGLEHLKQLDYLTSLDLSGTRVTAEGVKALQAALPGLSVLGEYNLPAAQRPAVARLKRVGVRFQTRDGQVDHAVFPARNGFNNQSSFTDADLDYLKDLPTLRSLSLSSTAITDASLAHLRPCTFLAHVDMGFTFVTLRGMLALSRDLPKTNLNCPAGSVGPMYTGSGGGRGLTRHLRLPQRYSSSVILDDVTDDDTAALHVRPEIEALFFRGGAKVTDAGLAHLEALPHLRQLSILSGNSNVTSAGFAPVQDMEELLVLCVFRTAFDDAMMARVEHLTKLQWLDLAETKVTDTGLKHLDGMQQLLILNLAKAGPGITDAGMKQIAKLSGLRRLDLTQLPITDTGMAELAGLTELRDLFLGGTKVTDAGLAHLKGMSHLERLVLDGTGVTDTGLEHLAALRTLEVVTLKETSVTVGGMEELRAKLKGVLFDFPSRMEGPR